MEVGQVFKSWKELCIFIDQPILTSNSLVAQKKRFEEYFTYHKKGRSIIIDSIIKTDGVSLSHGLFAHDIQSLLLNMLATHYIATEKNTMLITHNILSEKLALTSERFRKSLTDKKFVADKHNIDSQIVSDFFYEVTRQNKKRIVRSLDGLSKDGFIEYSIVGMIAYTIGKDVKRRKMNSIEERAFEEASEIVKEELNIKNQYVAAMHGLTKKYNSRLIEEISRILRLDNIKYCFQSYEIKLSRDITCDDGILNSLLLKEVKEIESRLQVNNIETVIDRFKKINNKSIDKLSKEYGSIHPMDLDKHIIRADNDFMSNITMLIEEILLNDSS